MICPYCDKAVFKASPDGSRLKARTSILVLHKSGGVEINCAACGHGVLLPLELSDGPFALRKSEAEPRFVVPKGA